jgi:hypothetical protein
MIVRGYKAPGFRPGLRGKDTQDARLLLNVSPGCFASTQKILRFPLQMRSLLPRFGVTLSNAL